MRVRRMAVFLFNCLRLRSVSRALWVDSYDNHRPEHGK